MVTRTDFIDGACGDEVPFARHLYGDPIIHRLV
jgi:hypothetical protein